MILLNFLTVQLIVSITLARDYTDQIMKGPFCQTKVLLDSSNPSLQDSEDINYASMERVLLDYRNDMRPNAFQCCRDESTGVVQGFRMHHKELPVGSDQTATTGCIGECRADQCQQAQVAFTYSAWYMDFVFTVERQQNDSLKVHQITVRDYQKDGQVSALDICGQQVNSADSQEKLVLAPNGIPVGFEFSYDPEAMAFSHMALVGNACPYHEQHLKNSGGGDVLSFFLVDRQFDADPAVLSQGLNLGDSNTFQPLQQPFVIAIQDDEHLQTNGPDFYRRILVVNTYEHFALANEDDSRYNFEQPDESFKLAVWSMFESSAAQDVPLPYIELEDASSRTDSERFSLIKFTSEKAKWPTSARHDYLKVQLSYGDHFAYSQVIEVSFIHFDQPELGRIDDDQSTCYYEEPTMDAFIPATDLSQYDETKLSEQDVKTAYRSDGYSSQQTVIVCCRDAEGVVTVTSAAKILLKDVESYWSAFTKTHGQPGRVCQGALAPTTKISSYALVPHQSSENKDESSENIFGDIQLFSQGIWKSACTGASSDSSPSVNIDAQVKYYETSLNGNLIGLNSITRKTQSGDDVENYQTERIVHISFVFNRCQETPSTVKQAPNFILLTQEDQIDEVVTLQDLRFNLPEIFGSQPSPTLVPAKPLSVQSDDFLSLGYCTAKNCLFESVSLLENLTVTILDEPKTVSLPAWSPDLWRQNQLLYTTLMQTFEVTPGFSFRFARRLWVVVYSLPSLQDELKQGCSLSQNVRKVTYFRESQASLLVKPLALDCAQVIQDLLEKLATIQVTKLYLIDMTSGQNVRELLPYESLSFPELADSRKTFTVEQETTLFYSETEGHLMQDLGDLQSDVALQRVVVTSTLLEIAVETCHDLVIDFENPLSDMVVLAIGVDEQSSATQATQSIPELIDLMTSQKLKQFCWDGIRVTLDVQSNDRNIRKAISLSADSRVVRFKAPRQAFDPTIVDISVTFEETLLLQQTFMVEALPQPDLPVARKIAPVFSDTDLKLPDWTIDLSSNTTQSNYRLPMVIDPDSSTVSLSLGIKDRELISCDCVKIGSINELVFQPPQRQGTDLESPLSAQFGLMHQIDVLLSDEESTVRYPLFIFFQYEGDSSQQVSTIDEEDEESDSNEGASDTDVSGQVVDSSDTDTSQTQVIPDFGDQYNATTITAQAIKPLEQQEVLDTEVYFELEQFSFNPWAEQASKRQKRIRDAQELCMPLQVKASAKGEVFVKFNKKIELENTDKAFIEEIKDKGSIQVQLLTSSKPESEDSFDFEWNLKQSGDKELMFSIDFARAEMISSSSVYTDQLQIVFVKTDEFLQCLQANSTTNTAQKRRELSTDEILDRQARYMPPFYSLLVDLPSQKGGNTTVAVVLEELIDSIGNTTETSVYSGFSVSQLVKLPMQFVWAGINSVQLISHLPLNEIIFPANSVDFFNYLAMVVSFDVYPPTERYDFGLTPSEPRSLGFEMLDYETVNFFDALGSIVLIFIFILLRIIVQPSVVWLVTQTCGRLRCSCCRKYCDLNGYNVSNILIRFLLETYLELVIASLLGITLKDSILEEDLNILDKLSIYGAYITLGIWVGFVLLVAFLTLYSARTLVKTRRNQLKDFDAKVKKDFYDDEDTQKRFAWVFRSKTFISKKQQNETLRRGKTLEHKELSKQVSLVSKRSTFLNRSLDQAYTRRFYDEIEESEYKSKRTNKNSRRSLASSMTESLKVSLNSLDVTIKEESHLAQNGNKSNGIALSDIKLITLKSNLASAPDRDLSAQISHSFVFSSSQSQQSQQAKDQLDGNSKAQNELFIEEEVPAATTDRPLTVEQDETTTKRLKAKAVVAKSEKEEPKVSMVYPGWYKYIREIFLHLDHKHQMSLQVNLFFLVRRIVFVATALYVVGSPATQAAIFVQFSLLQCSLLVANLPYETPLFNILETFNEFTVLTIGYHVMILIFEPLQVQTRERLGMSMMIIISGMIGINGLNWLYHLVKQIYRSVRRCYYTGLRYKMRRKQIRRLTLIREKKTSAATVKDDSKPGLSKKQTHRRTGSVQQLLSKNLVLNPTSDLPMNLPVLEPKIESFSEVEDVKEEVAVLRQFRIEHDSYEEHGGTLETTRRSQLHQGRQVQLMELPVRKRRMIIMSPCSPLRQLTIPSATKLKMFGNTGFSHEKSKMVIPIPANGYLESSMQIVDYSGLSIGNFEQCKDNSDRLHVSVNEIDFEMSSKESERPDQCTGPHLILPPKTASKRTPQEGKVSGKPSLIIDALMEQDINSVNPQSQEGCIPRPAKRKPR